MDNSRRLAACMLILLCWAGSVAADSFVGVFVGEFNGEEYRLALRAANGNQYEGAITIAGEPVPLVAQRFGEQLRGRLGIGGDSFEFSAEMKGDFLFLQDDNGEIIRFERE